MPASEVCAASPGGITGALSLRWILICGGDGGESWEFPGRVSEPEAYLSTYSGGGLGPVVLWEHGSRSGRLLMPPGSHPRHRSRAPAPEKGNGGLLAREDAMPETLATAQSTWTKSASSSVPVGSIGEIDRYTYTAIGFTAPAGCYVLALPNILSSGSGTHNTLGALLPRLRVGFDLRYPRTYLGRFRTRLIRYASVRRISGGTQAHPWLHRRTRFKHQDGV